MSNGNRRGPAPERAAVKKAKGNPGKRPIETEDDENLLASMESDSELTGWDGQSAPEFVTGSGLEVWNQQVPMLQKIRLFSAVDRLAFGRYCQNFGLWMDAQKSVLENGLTYPCQSAHGNYVKANPAFMIASRLERELQSVEVKFGLNPADRQRLFAGRAGVQGTGDLFGSDSDGVGGENEHSSAIGLLLN